MSVSFVISCTIGQSAYPSRRCCHLTVCELHFTTKLGTGDGAAFASDVFFSFVLLSAKKKKKITTGLPQSEGSVWGICTQHFSFASRCQTRMKGVIAKRASEKCVTRGNVVLLKKKKKRAFGGGKMTAIFFFLPCFKVANEKEGLMQS